MIKEAAPNILQYFDILRKKPANFSLVSGDDEYTLPVTLAGGDGVISVIGQGYPKGIFYNGTTCFRRKSKRSL